MCISVLTTSHPNYPFILISNRDEFLARPTIHANWWDPPHQHVLGGRDLQRAERGTWLGITKQGRIAILTNFREEGDYAVNREKSRGAIVNSYLCLPPDSTITENEHALKLLTDFGLSDVGGFTMLFGRLRKPRPTADAETKTTPGLAIISNRTKAPGNLTRIATTLHETHGLSNSHYGDATWPKVVNGENYLSSLVSTSPSSRSSLIASLFDILSTDTLPSRHADESWQMYVRHMRESILIPPAKGQATRENTADDLRTADEGLKKSQAVLESGKGAYGTSKQTVVLVDWEGKVVFVERTLFDGEGRDVTVGEGDVVWEFDIEGWNDDHDT